MTQSIKSKAQEIRWTKNIDKYRVAAHKILQNIIQKQKKYQQNEKFAYKILCFRSRVFDYLKHQVNTI